MKIKASLRGLMAAATFMALGSGSASAIDGMSVVYGDGEGDDAIDMYRVGVQWDWYDDLYQTEDWQLVNYLELDAGYWDGKSTAANSNSSLIDIGITPVFRFQMKANSGFQPYVEGGIGAHLLSESKINSKDISTNFQFGDHLGFGARLGDKLQWDIGYRFQHFSNAGIEKPNPGVNFHQIRFGMRFD